MAVTGASLSGIYDRLNNSSTRPMSASTFSDWSLEAGDRVTLTRDGQTYQGTVHNSSMSWKGKTPTVEINSTGNEKRDAVSKAEKKKYNRGGSGVRNDENMYVYEVNQDHLLYEVYDSQGRFSKLEVTVRGLFHEVYDTNGRFSALQNTVNGLRHEVYDTDGRFSVLQNTVNGLRHEVYDTDGRFSLLQNTVDGLHHEVYDTNGSFSILSNTVDGLHHEVYEEGGAISVLENTAKGFRTSISQVVGPDGRITSASIATAINGSSSEVYISADHIRISGNMMISALMSGDNSGNLIVANNIYAGLGGSNYIQGKTLRLVGSSSSQGADVQILSSEDIKNMIVKVDTSTPNILKMWKHGSNLSGDPTWTFSKAVSLSGDWNGRNYTVTAKQNNVTVGTKIGIVYDGIVPVEGTITKNSKTVYKDFKVYSDDGEGNADKLIMTKNLSINASSVYNDGWDYGQTQRTRATRDATSQELTIKTLDYGQRWTIVDTYTASNGTTSDVKYTVASKADRYSDGYSAGYNAGWDYGQGQRTRTTRDATNSETTIKTLSSAQRWTIQDVYTKSDGTTTTVKYTVAAPTIPTASDIQLYAGGAGEITRSTSKPSGNGLSSLAQALVQAYLNQDGKGRYVRFPATITGGSGTKYYYIYM